MERFGLTPASGIHLAEPLPYMEFLHLWKDARVVLTDSGGLQEETTALGIPCLTVRENTEGVAGPGRRADAAPPAAKQEACTQNPGLRHGRQNS